MFIASANVNDDQRASEREVFEYECCSDLVDLFQSMHSFVGMNEDLAKYRHSLSEQQKQLALEDYNDGSNNNNKGDINSAGSSPSTTNTTFPLVNNAIMSGKEGENNNNGDHQRNNNAHGNNNNDNSNNNASSNNNNHKDGNVVARADQVAKNNNDNNYQIDTQQQLQVGDLVDTTQSAVFTFPAARPHDSIKPVYLVRQVGSLLTLVVGLKNENVDAMKSAIEYNIDNLERALQKILNINEEVLKRSS